MEFTFNFHTILSQLETGIARDSTVLINMLEMDLNFAGLQDSLVPSLSVKFPRGVVWYWVMGIGIEIGHNISPLPDMVLVLVNVLCRYTWV